MKYKFVLSSQRLFVRTWLEQDVEGFYKIMSNLYMHTYTSTGEPWTEEKTRIAIDYCMRHKLGFEPGYFNCPLLLKENNELIGRVGLNLFNEAKRIPEIEWKIAQAHWGKGYASEIGREILRYGFEVASFETIIGFTFPEHKASCRLMQKIGMQGPQEGEYRGRLWSFFHVDKSDFGAV